LRVDIKENLIGKLGPLLSQPLLQRNRLTAIPAGMAHKNPRHSRTSPIQGAREIRGTQASFAAAHSYHPSLQDSDVSSRPRTAPVSERNTDRTQHILRTGAPKRNPRTCSTSS
jgi:hypothetical protein